MKRVDSMQDLERDGDVRRLLEEAGPPPAVPAEEMEQFKAVAREAWEQRPREPVAAQRSANLGIWAVAATLLLTLSLAWLWRAQAPPAPLGRVAAVDRWLGEVRFGDAGEPLVKDAALVEGSLLETGPGRSLAALRLPNGHSLRIDRSSRVRLLSEGRVELERGALYVDSGPGDSGSIEVTTSFGVITDVGTQFEVRTDAETVVARVRVREGAVVWTSDQGNWEAAAGEQLELAADGEVERTEIERSGESWGWVQAVAPAFDTDGALLGDFLDWVSREGGWKVDFSSTALSVSASSVVLSGSVEGLTPLEAIAVVAPAAKLDWTLEAGVLRLSPALP